MRLYYSVIDHRGRQNVLEVSVSLMFLPHFDVFCDLLLKRPTTTWNLFVLSETHIREFLALYNELKRKSADKHTCLEPLEFSMICTSLDIFKSQTLVVFSASSVFLYVTCKQFLWNVF